MLPKRKSGGEHNDSLGDQLVGVAEAGGSTLNTGLAISAPSAITSQDIEDALSRYETHIQKLGLKPGSKLRELDDWRLKQLSTLVKARDPPYLEKEELQRLMEWKLTRGKFRPTLSDLIAQNTTQKVKESTQAAFTALSQFEIQSANNKETTDETSKSFRALVRQLCAGLKGVGPATASLVLSVYDNRVPFMSDESYIWAMHADEEARTGKTKLKREIKYTEKGYLEYAIRMWEIASVANRSAAELEQVGWVLGSEWMAGGVLKRPEVGMEEGLIECPKTPAESPEAQKSKKRKRRRI